MAIIHQAHSGVFSAEAAADEGRRQRVKLLQLNAYDRHKQLVNTYQVMAFSLKFYF